VKQCPQRFLSIRDRVDTLGKGQVKQSPPFTFRPPGKLRNYGFVKGDLCAKGALLRAMPVPASVVLRLPSRSR
jgi:hypothetical protein